MRTHGRWCCWLRRRPAGVSRASAGRGVGACAGGGPCGVWVSRNGSPAVELQPATTS